MLARFFDAGGPVMYAVLVAWVLVLAGVLDRLLYAAGRGFRRPMRAVGGSLARGERAAARLLLERERLLAGRGLERIDAISQIAPSVGLFGTVLGMAEAFFSRGGELGLSAPEVLASGLATALFTTIGGLVVFLVGQGFLILWREWEGMCERGVEELALEAERLRQHLAALGA